MVPAPSSNCAAATAEDPTHALSRHRRAGPGARRLDASRIGDEVIAHLTGLVGADVRVTLEIEADIPSGAPEHVVRTVTENGRTLKFTSQGFEQE